MSSLLKRRNVLLVISCLFPRAVINGKTLKAERDQRACLLGEEGSGGAGEKVPRFKGNNSLEMRWADGADGKGDLLRKRKEQVPVR